MFRSITSSFPPANFEPVAGMAIPIARRHLGQGITSTPHWVSPALPTRSCRKHPSISNAISRPSIHSAPRDAKRSRR